MRPDKIRGGAQFVATLTPQEWAERADTFEMGIDMDLDLNSIQATRADVNYDPLTGTFRIPNRDDLWGEPYRFAFAPDEKGIVFIDAGGFAEETIERIRRTRKRRAEHSEYEQKRKDSLDIGSLPCELTGRLFFRLYSARIRDYLQ